VTAPPSRTAVLGGRVVGKALAHATGSSSRPGSRRADEASTISPGRPVSVWPTPRHLQVSFRARLVQAVERGVACHDRLATDRVPPLGDAARWEAVQLAEVGGWRKVTSRPAPPSSIGKGSCCDAWRTMPWSFSSRRRSSTGQGHIAHALSVGGTPSSSCGPLPRAGEFVLLPRPSVSCDEAVRLLLGWLPSVAPSEGQPEWRATGIR